jgi:hypothetical protein
VTLKPALIFIPAMIALAAPAFAQDQSINTGHWEARTAWLGLSGSTEEWCVKPKDVSKFLSGPSNHIYHCTYPISRSGAGAIHFEGSCVDKHGQEIKLKGQGDYTPTTMHMTATGTATLLGVPITGDASVDAHFVSSICPPEAKAFS